MFRTKPVTGEGEIAAYLRSLRAEMRAQRIISGPNYRVKNYSYGTALDIPGIGSSGKAGKLSVQLVWLYSISLDGTTLNCWTQPGGPFGGGSLVNVAKSTELNHLIQAETIEGQNIAYTYASRASNLDGQRTAANQSTGETQIEIVIPVYKQDDPIYAITVPNGGSSIVIDLNVDARAWCQIG